MAKPIRATPTLRGEDAERFVKQMIKKETSAVSKADKVLYADAEKTSIILSHFLIKSLYIGNVPFSLSFSTSNPRFL